MAVAGDAEEVGPRQPVAAEGVGREVEPVELFEVFAHVAEDVRDLHRLAERAGRRFERGDLRPLVDEERQHHRAHAARDEVGVGQQVVHIVDAAAPQVPLGAVEQFVERLGEEGVLLVDLGEALPQENVRRPTGERAVESVPRLIDFAQRLIRADGEHALIGDRVHGPAVEVERSDREPDLAGEQARGEGERTRVVAEGLPEVAVLGVPARPGGRDGGRHSRRWAERRHTWADTGGRATGEAGRRSPTRPSTTARATRPRTPASAAP